MKELATCNFKPLLKSNLKNKICFFVLLLIGCKIFADTPVFTFHVSQEPISIEPWKQKGSGSQYFYSQLFVGLMRYQDKKLQGDLAEKCIFKKPKLIECVLKKNLKWSDGSKLLASDFLIHVQNMINPKNRSPKADMFFNIKNAKDIFEGKLDISKLGLKVDDPKGKIEIELANPDPDFLYSLSHPLLALAKFKSAKEFLSSGPYKLKEWKSNDSIILEPNGHFQFEKAFQRPNLQIKFIPEDTIALQHYEKNNLSFLRRLPSLLIPKYQTKPDFFQTEQIRFDYIGFIGKLKDNKTLRKKISESINYEDFNKLYHASKPRPGCPGLPDDLMDQKYCLDTNPSEAKKIDSSGLKFKYLSSKQGGDDHKKTSEWLQEQWKKMDLNVQIEQIDNNVFITEVESNKVDLFRKGIAPERPTCLAALESFQSSNPENYIQLKSKSYDDIVNKLALATKNEDKKKYCSQAIKFLLEDYLLIPTGPIHFSMLLKPQWQGLKLNELNQLDLRDLRLKN